MGPRLTLRFRLGAGLSLKSEPETKHVFAIQGKWFPDAFGGSTGQLMRAITEDREPETSGADNLESIKIAYAAVESSRSGRAVELAEIGAECSTRSRIGGRARWPWCRASCMSSWPRCCGKRPQAVAFPRQVAQPILFRDCLLTLRDVVNTRFYRPDLWKLMDPVVSIEQEWVRLECFSSDGGVYARVDLSPNTFHEGEMGSPGTTNVDFGADFAADLPRSGPVETSSSKWARISPTLHTSSLEGGRAEGDLLVRGCAVSVEAIQRAAKPALALGRNDARQLDCASRPRPARGEIHWATLRWGRAAAPRAEGCTGDRGDLPVQVDAPAGSAGAVLARWAVGGARPSSFWTADLGVARVTMEIPSVGRSQGFSGDGEALRSARNELAPDSGFGGPIPRAGHGARPSPTQAADSPWTKERRGNWST